jgi:Bacterial protein of unknown function (DUF882)
MRPHSMAHTDRSRWIPGWVGSPERAACGSPAFVAMSITTRRRSLLSLRAPVGRTGVVLSSWLLLALFAPCTLAQQRVAAEESPASPLSGVSAEPALGREPADIDEAKPKAKSKWRAKLKVKEKTKPLAKVKRVNTRWTKRPWREREPNEQYRKMRDSWHAPVHPEAVPTLEVTGRVPLVLQRVVGGVAPVTLVPQRDDGGFSEEDQARASRAFCSPDAKQTHAVAPRLLDLIYRTMRHFEAPLVHVVSGYRKDRAGSRHTQGRAIDMVIPGVTNEQLAEYVRQFGFVGVGIYPKSGFVHLDVRDRSYFWLDFSMPGERSRSVPHLANEAIAADVAARARGESPNTFVPGNEREDRAAVRSYARRAKVRRLRAERKAAQAQAEREANATASARAGVN